MDSDPKPRETVTQGRRFRQWPQWYSIETCKDDELTGSLRSELKRCGRSNCKCVSGREEDLHGPYWYRYFREDGRQRKEYVKKCDLDDVREKIERRRERLKNERAARRRHMRRGKGGGKNAYQKRQERLRRLPQGDTLDRALPAIAAGESPRNAYLRAWLDETDLRPELKRSLREQLGL